MKHFLMLALLISVFSVSMSAQVSSESWTRKYDSDMDAYADVRIYNETFKTISTVVFRVTVYGPGHEQSWEEIRNCKILPYTNGHVHIFLVHHQYDDVPGVDFRISILKVRYSDDSADNVNHLVPKK